MMKVDLDLDEQEYIYNKCLTSYIMKLLITAVLQALTDEKIDILIIKTARLLVN